MNIYRRAMLAVAGAALILVAGLMVSELRSPGTCPLLLGLPACYVVFVLYLAVPAAHFMPRQALADKVYWAAVLVGLAIAVWFSANQLLGREECPLFLTIPLCFGAAITWGVLIWLKLKEQAQTAGQLQ